MIIDSHHHFWRYDPVAHAWIDPDTMGALARDFLPNDLLEECELAGVDAVISVQAAQTLDETRMLLDFAEKTPLVAGVVGWAPLVADDIEEELQRIAHPLLKGIRHVVQDEPDDRFLLRDDFNRGIAALGNHDLTYDVLVFERQLAAAIEFVDRHPEQQFVLDHIAKPRIADSQLEPWRTNMQQIAQRPNVVCKISGVVTEADWAKWDKTQITPYLDTALESFGPNRLMFGSDWPVCLLATDYKSWLQVVDDWSSTFSEAERRRLFSETAMEAYQLEIKGSLE